MFRGLVCRAVVCGDGDDECRFWGPIPACAGMTKDKDVITGLPRLRLAMTRVMKS